MLLVLVIVYLFLLSLAVDKDKVATVARPLSTSCNVKYITIVNPAENIAFCQKLSVESDDVVLSAMA